MDEGVRDDEKEMEDGDRAAPVPQTGWDEDLRDGGLHEPSGFLDAIMRQRDFEGIFENRNISGQIVARLGLIFLLAGFYGLVMGAPNGWKQVISSGIKVPVLYLLTLFICFPVLHVVNVLMGSRLSFLQTVALILSALTLNCILLASCAPIVAFFILTGANYPFQKLLHVLICGLAGIWGMIALGRGLSAMCERSDLYPMQAFKILRLWIIIFAFVGTQMAWSLRPFVGSPALGFQIFRKQEGNFYRAVWQSLVDLLDQDYTVGPPEPPDRDSNQ